MTPYARKRLQPREHRTPRRLRPQPGPERPQPLRIAATVPDELADRVPGDSADRGDCRRRSPNRVFEEGRSSAVDGRGAMVEGWPTIWPSLGPQRYKSEEPERSQRTQRREKESRETGHFFLFGHRPKGGPPSRHLGKSGLGRSLALPENHLSEQPLNHPESNRRSAAHASNRPGMARPEPVAVGRRLTSGTLRYEVNSEILIY